MGKSPGGSDLIQIKQTGGHSAESGITYPTIANAIFWSLDGFNPIATR
jgi:hypothetical protein